MISKMPSSKTARLSDVAQAAGVSIGTASRVLNDSFRVNALARAAVRKAIDELGYVPPPIEKRSGRRAGIAAAKSTGRLLVLLPGPVDLKWLLDHAPVYAYALHSIEREVANRGLTLSIQRFDDWETIPRLVAADNMLRGLIFLGWAIPGYSANMKFNVPAVWTMGLNVEFTGDHFVPNGLLIGKLAAEYLLRRGHRHCAILGPQLDLSRHAVVSFGDRFAAFIDCVEAQGGDVLQLIDSNLTSDEAELATETLVQRLVDAKPRPKGLFCWSASLAPLVYRCLEKRGIVIGKDIDIILCNNDRPFLAALRPQPAVIDIQPEYIGRRAVERLLWRIDNLDSPAEKVAIAPKLLEKL